MSRFNNKELDNYDVMQHVQNIYNIIGTTGKASVETRTANNIVERLNEIKTTNIVDWIGTKAEYDAAKSSGFITPNMVCAITDDYYVPEKA